jgi:hypothetical protein
MRRTRRTLSRGLALALGLAWPSAALACPDCDVSRAARSAVIGDPSLLPRFLLMVLPLAVIGALAAMLYRVGSSRDETTGGQR